MTVSRFVLLFIAGCVLAALVTAFGCGVGVGVAGGEPASTVTATVRSTVQTTLRPEPVEPATQTVTATTTATVTAEAAVPDLGDVDLDTGAGLDTTLMLDLMWTQMTEADRSDVCDGVDVLGPELAGTIMLGAAAEELPEIEMDYDAAARWAEAACS